MSTRELQRRLIENLREWQKLENAQITLTGTVLEETSNRIVAMVMEIIQRDSQMHLRVQQLLIDSLESEVVTIAPEEVDLLRQHLAEHLAMEEETVRLARDNLESLAGRQFLVQEFLLDFLRRDEEKHRDLLTALESFCGPATKTD
jgi:hypothetical protein